MLLLLSVVSNNTDFLRVTPVHDEGYSLILGLRHDHSSRGTLESGTVTYSASGRSGQLRSAMITQIINAEKIPVETINSVIN